MTKLAALLPLLLVACCSPDGNGSRPEPRPARRTLFLLPVRADAEVLPGIAADAVARVEVAADDTARWQGLMHRESLREDHGMLFIYPTEGPRAFWMKNTLIPLSIAFATSTGRIVSIRDMVPGAGTPDADLPRYESGEPATFALEMDKGWFKAKGIRVGDRMEFHPEVAAVTVR